MYDDVTLCAQSWSSPTQSKVTNTHTPSLSHTHVVCACLSLCCVCVCVCVIMINKNKISYKKSCTGDGRLHFRSTHGFLTGVCVSMCLCVCVCRCVSLCVCVCTDYLLWLPHSFRVIQHCHRLGSNHLPAPH